MKRSIILFVLFFTVNAVYAVSDTLLLNNGNVIIGEVKDMDRGVLTIETDYSDSDFKIEWEKIIKINTETYFLITLADGRRFNGHLSSTDSSSVDVIGDGVHESVHRQNIVYLKSVDSGFWSKLNASVDVGYNLTKAQNAQQFSVRSNIGYLAERWLADASYNNVFSSQDDAEDVHRIDAGLSYRYFLPHDWYLPVQLSWLSNTEQSLKLRTVGKVGLGKYLVHTNKKYWGLQAGVSFNNEAYYGDNAPKKSGEGFFGTELNLYDIGDLSLLTNLVAYPSITESKRWRVDYSLDTKYDLPLDFYIKIGFTLNYDNQAVEGASDTDYVLQTSFGWEL